MTVSATAAVTQQPLSTEVDCHASAFQFYSSGVMTAACGTGLDHSLLAVGFGTDGANQYYKLKNSWGASWGEAGYVRLGRGPQYNGGAGQCGVLSGDISYPTA